MFHAVWAIFGIALLACLVPDPIHAQASQPNPLLAGTTVRVTLQKPLDARKNKPGDPVIVKSAESVKSDGHDVLPKGSKIIGHLTTVKSHSKGQPDSALGIIFERSILKDGREIPLRLTIQAVAPGQESVIPTMSMTPATAAGTSGGMGPVTGPLTAGPTSDPNAGTPGRVSSPENPVQSPADNMTSRGELTPSCHGVLGMEGLVLAPEDPTLGSLIVSRQRNIQLDIGTQMMLRVPED